MKVLKIICSAGALWSRAFVPMAAGLCLMVTISCRQAERNAENQPQPHFSLDDFFGSNTVLDSLVSAQLATLTREQRAGQMIIAAAGRLGRPDNEIDRLIEGHCIGGVLLLNGTVSTFAGKVRHFDSLNTAYGGLPLLYSADAEPSLVNRKIEGSTPVPATSRIGSDSICRQVAGVIADDLLKIGIRHNYAPVVDLSQSNAAITNRSFSQHPDTAVSRALAFIEVMQQRGILATAKHFPGHGLVEGDTHHKLVYISGPMQEVAVYRPLIEGGVLSIMVGHIAVERNKEYDTRGLPATCSENIVTVLLRDSLRYQGLVITDAMNMGALAEVKNAAVQAVEAGCDLILMPPDEMSTRSAIAERMASDLAFEKRVNAAVQRILRAKWCLGLMR